MSKKDIINSIFKIGLIIVLFAEIGLVIFTVNRNEEIYKLKTEINELREERKINE